MTYEDFSNYVNEKVKAIRDSAIMCQLNINHIDTNSPMADLLFKKMNDYADSYIADLGKDDNENDLMEYAIDRLLSIKDEFQDEAAEIVRIAKIEGVDSEAPDV